MRDWKRVLSFSEMQGVGNSRDHIVRPSWRDLPVGWDDSELKKKVLDYMSSRQFVWIKPLSPSYSDIFTGERVKVNGRIYHDDEWRWLDESVYYIDIHDFQVPPEFVEHVLAAYNDGFVPDPDMHWR